MMRSLSLISSSLAVSLLVGCGASPADPEDDFQVQDDDDDSSTGGGDGDTGSGDGSGGSAFCTPDNDVVPMQDIVDAIQNVAGTYVYDIARADDGTVYFISGMSAESASVGRREPCGEIEREWMTASVPIEHIEISSDNYLYFAANGMTSPTARIYRLDLGDVTSLPEKLTSQAGYRIESMSAGPNGRVFLSRYGSNGISLGFVGSDGNVKLPWNLGDGHALVAAKPDGSAFVYRKALTGAHYGGAMTVSSAGAVSVTTTVIPAGGPLDYDVSAMHADASGGLYMQRMDNGATSQACRLTHATDLLSPRTQVADVAYHYHCSTQFGIDEPTSATVVSGGSETSNTDQSMTAVTLPVPVMEL